MQSGQSGIENPNQFIEGTDMAPLHFFVQKGDTTAVSQLLADPRVDVNKIDRNGFTPLFYAVQKADQEMISMLLGHSKVDPNKADKMGRGVLQFAAEVHHQDQDKLSQLLTLLLNHPKINVNQLDLTGSSPLHFALRKQYQLLALRLLEHPGTDFNLANLEGQTALHIASAIGNEAVVSTLLKKPEIELNLLDHENNTPFGCAVKGNQVNILMAFLEKVQMRDSDKHAVLYYAVSQGYKEMVALLLRKLEIDINVDGGYGIPLHVAALGNHEEVLSLLLAQPNINVDRVNWCGQTALFFAIQRKNVAIVSLLLEKSANICHTDNSGQTPLMCAAAINGNKEIVALLLTRPNINVNERDSRQHTALFYAVAQSEDKEIVALLLEKSANVDEIGLDLINHAVINQKTDMVIMLYHHFLKKPLSSDSNTVLFSERIARYILESSGKELLNVMSTIEKLDDIDFAIRLLTFWQNQASLNNASSATVSSYLQPLKAFKQMNNVIASLPSVFADEDKKFFDDGFQNRSFDFAKKDDKNFSIFQLGRLVFALSQRDFRKESITHLQAKMSLVYLISFVIERCRAVDVSPKKSETADALVSLMEKNEIQKESCYGDWFYVGYLFGIIQTDYDIYLLEAFLYFKPDLYFLKHGFSGKTILQHAVEKFFGENFSSHRDKMNLTLFFNLPEEIAAESLQANELFRYILKLSDASLNEFIHAIKNDRNAVVISNNLIMMLHDFLERCESSLTEDQKKSSQQIQSSFDLSYQFYMTMKPLILKKDNILQKEYWIKVLLQGVHDEVLSSTAPKEIAIYNIGKSYRLLSKQLFNKEMTLSDAVAKILESINVSIKVSKGKSYREKSEIASRLQVFQDSLSSEQLTVSGNPNGAFYDHSLPKAVPGPEQRQSMFDV